MDKKEKSIVIYEDAKGVVSHAATTGSEPCWSYFPRGPGSSALRSDKACHVQPGRIRVLIGVQPRGNPHATWNGSP